MKDLIISLLIIVFFNSCISTSKIQIEILRPAKDSLLISNTECVLSNMYLTQNKKNKNEFENSVDYDKYRLDSLVSVEALKVVRSEIESADMIYITQFDSLKSIKRNNETQIQIKNVDIRSLVETEPTYINNRGEYYAVVMVSYLVDWQIITNKNVQIKTFNDTVWVEGYKSKFKTLAELVNFNNVIKYIIDKTAVEYAHYIAPTWNTVDRYFIESGNNDFIRAAYFVRKRNYDKAAGLWKKYLTSRNNISSRAYYNMAVYHEIKGNLNEAIEFANKAVKQNSKLARKYLKVLKQRKKEVLYLKKKYNN